MGGRGGGLEVVQLEEEFEGVGQGGDVGQQFGGGGQQEGDSGGGEVGGEDVVAGG